MDCNDYVVLAFLLMACGTTTMVFADGTKELNGHCQVVGDCYKIGYFCARNRTCQCRTGYVSNAAYTKCVGIVNSKCIYDTQCIDGAYCGGNGREESCLCRKEDNYYSNDDGTTCTASAVPNYNQNFSFSLLLTMLCTSLYLNT